MLKRKTINPQIGPFIPRLCASLLTITPQTTQSRITTNLTVPSLMCHPLEILSNALTLKEF